MSLSVGWVGTGGSTVTDEGRMAYIDSELAKRRVEGAQAQSSQPQSYGSLGSGMGGFEMQVGSNREGKKEVEVQRQPAALGKLLEIDLGDEARSKNVMRTEQARRRLDGEEIEDEDKPGKPGKPGKVRLGRDGKPWRGRKRRGSDDVKRDKLVEEVLRENRRKSLLFCDSEPHLLIFLQWRSMRSLWWSLRLLTMTKLQMIGLRKRSGKNLWMLCLHDRGRRQHLLHLQVEQLAGRKRKRL